MPAWKVQVDTIQNISLTWRLLNRGTLRLVLGARRFALSAFLWRPETIPFSASVRNASPSPWTEWPEVGFWFFQSTTLLTRLSRCSSSGASLRYNTRQGKTRKVEGKEPLAGLRCLGEPDHRVPFCLRRPTRWEANTRKWRCLVTRSSKDTLPSSRRT